LAGAQLEPTMKKPLICSTFLALAAPTVFAAGLDLTWRACSTDPGSTSFAVLDCAAPGGAAIDLFGCFQIAATQDSVVAMDCILNLGVQDPNGPPLDDFWHFESGGCNDLANGSAVVSITRPDTLCSGTVSPWTRQTTFGFGYFAASSSCKAAFLLSIVQERALTLLANTNYFAFKMTLVTTQAAENGTGKCLGCSYPGFLVWSSATLANIRGGGGNPYFVDGPGLVSSCMTFNPGASCWCNTDCFLSCPLVPVRNKTWGQLKSLYR
jgi:hypothetical protein